MSNDSTELVKKNVFEMRRSPSFSVVDMTGGVFFLFLRVKFSDRNIELRVNTTTTNDIYNT